MIDTAFGLPEDLPFDLAHLRHQVTFDAPPGIANGAPRAAHAAPGRLDQTVRENRPWARVWRRRLALGAAAARMRRAEQSEDEAALRDAVHLTGPGADPGPAGRRLLAWRALGAGSVGQWRSAIAVAAAALGLPGDEAL
jgi:hypothetical protein